MSRKTIAEQEAQIKAMEERLRKLKARKNEAKRKEEAREREVMRKEENHIKFMLGGMVLRELRKRKPDLHTEDINFDQLDKYFSGSGSSYVQSRGVFSEEEKRRIEEAKKEEDSEEEEEEESIFEEE